MKKTLICLWLLIQQSCFGALNPIEFQLFITEYSNSAEKKLMKWSEVVYGIEKDYDDELVIFILKKIGLGNPVYPSRLEETNYDMSDINYKSILATCIRKNRPKILESILNTKGPLNINYGEHNFHYFSRYRNHWYKIQERNLLNIAIEESDNSLTFLKILCEHGADVNCIEHYSADPTGLQKEDHFRTPLISAVMKGKLGDVNFLLTCGANANPLNIYPLDTPLHIAINNEKLDIAKALLTNKASALDGSLHYAVHNRKKNAVILLMNFGADPLQKFPGNDGWLTDKTAFEIALQSQDPEIINILTSAVFNKKTKQTPVFNLNFHGAL